MQRAHTQVEIRAVDDEQRIIEGVATSAAEDTHGTVLEPAGAEFRLPLPFHWHHRKSEPVGNVIATWLEDGLRWVRIHMPKVADDGTDGGRVVKRRVDAAWADIKAGLVRGLSVEFLPIEPRSQRAKRWTRWRWLGLGAVTTPSNIDATIMAIRSADQAARTASSPGLSGTPDPGLSGTEKRKTRSSPMTILEQIKDHESSRAAKVARKEALMETAATEGRTLDDAESEEFDTLDDEIRSIDGHLKRLNSLKRDNERAATAVNGASTNGAAQSRGNGDAPVQNRNGVPVVRVKQNEEPGTGYARYVMSLMACRGNHYEAAEYARSTWGEELGGAVALMHRAAVAPGTSAEATFAKPLVETTYLTELLEMLRPATLVGRIPGLRRVPFNVSMPSQTAGGTYKWVGEGKGKPVTNAQFGTVTLGMAKASGIIVLTKELVKSSAPAAQEVIRDELIQGMARFLDTQFIDPAVAAVANESPASITNGVTGFVASGTTEAAARADLRKLIANFATANYNLGGIVLLMSESTAFTIGTMVNAVGERAFPGLDVTGGTILGIPVVTSNTVGDQIVGAHAPSILLADDGATEVDVSEQATLRMDTEPDTPVGDPAVLPPFRSLWQDNLVGLRAERFINWGKARATSVDRIHTVAYV